MMHKNQSIFRTGYRIFWGILFLLPVVLWAQLSAPEVEAVYGGRIKSIAVDAVDAVTSIMFITTESANSAFYTTVSYSSGSPVIAPFQVVPDLDADDGFGSSLTKIAADGPSETYFVLHNEELLTGNTAPGTRSVLVSSGVRDVLVYQSHLFYVQQSGSGGLELHFGTISASTGAFSEDAASPLSVGSTSLPPNASVQMEISPVTGYLYLFIGGTPPTIYMSSDSYTAFTSTTTFSTLSVTDLGTTIEYRAFGIGPDGRLFVGAVINQEPNHGKFIGYTDDNGASWDTLYTGVGGTAGPNIACSPMVDTTYFVYFGSAVSNHKGEMSSWSGFGMGGQETHPNDGMVVADPIDSLTVYLTTDQGIGASTDGGFTIFEIDDGVEAVQVKDFEMEGGKDYAWLASKSGVRRVTGYSTSSKTWELFYPNGDGSPYYSIAMDTLHPDTAYAGNVRVYKTTDAGATWSQIFTTEDPSYSFDFWSYISAIEVVQPYPDHVFVGVQSPSSGVTGGIFYTTDGGSTWTQVSTGVYNPEVNDLLVVPVAGDTFDVYVACAYVSDGTTSSYGVKTVRYLASSGTATYQNDMMGESGIITNFGGEDLAKNSAGDVFVCGDNSLDEPRVYVLRKDSTYWKALPTAGLPGTGWCSAITIGLDSLGNEVPYIAIDSDIYYLDASGTPWHLVYSYPVGMEINFLYWDDLLVGTGTGLYAQYINITGIEDNDNDASVPTRFRLSQNYPNPFNPSTTIEYALPVRSRVKLEIYNLLGQRVAVLVNQIQLARVYRVRWNATVPGGVYFYRLQATPVQGGSPFQQIRKMILLK